MGYTKQIQEFLDTNTEFLKTIRLGFNISVAGEFFDPEEQNFNTSKEIMSVYIKGIVKELSAEFLVIKHFGLEEFGSVMIHTYDYNQNNIKTADTIFIEGIQYEVYKDSLGSKQTIDNRTRGVIRVILRKM